MSVLICGSIAYDTIMVFEGHFRDHILADQTHILNVAFLVPQMRREFGGCAGNIAYTLKGLGGDPIIMATAGEDIGPYRSRLQQLGMTDQHVRTIAGQFTAQAFITTDRDDNQITAFHPGAMEMAHENHVGDVEGATLGIVAPDGKASMLQHVSEFAHAQVPFIFDPGQGLPMFTGAELEACIEQSCALTLNDYEAQLLMDKTGKPAASYGTARRPVLVTLGAKGSVVYQDGKVHRIAPVVAPVVEDPTGCGDAYRAGLLYGMSQNWDIDESARLASVLGSIKISTQGPQNHRVDKDQINDRFKTAFGRTIF